MPSPATTGASRASTSPPDAGSRWTQAEADLSPAPGRWAWRFWRTELDLPVGDTQIVVHAWDTAGASVPEDPAHL